MAEAGREAGFGSIGNGGREWKGRARLNGEGKGGLRERDIMIGKIDQDRERGRAFEAGRSELVGQSRE